MLKLAAELTLGHFSLHGLDGNGCRLPPKKQSIWDIPTTDKKIIKNFILDILKFFFSWILFYVRNKIF